jgi:hypothetical protein
MSTRKFDGLVAALAVEAGIFKCEVSRICTGISTSPCSSAAR